MTGAWRANKRAAAERGELRSLLPVGLGFPDSGVLDGACIYR
jgi:hypothetical protein